MTKKKTTKKPAVSMSSTLLETVHVLRLKAWLDAFPDDDDTITSEEYERYDELFYMDKSFVGTSAYLGLTYYWSTEYKHSCRAMTPWQSSFSSS